MYRASAWLAVAAASLAYTRINAQALAEPPEGKWILGIWPQADPGYQITPATVNLRTGINWGAFQLSQPIPVPAYDYVTGAGGPVPEAYIGATGTDADIFLTVYPNQGLAAVQDADILSLAIQLRSYQASGRTVFLRWAPEFSGNWMPYGLQPVAFVEVWIRMYNIIKAEAPDTVIVWSPNVGYSYPYGVSLSSIDTAADRQALDTNGDGVLSGADDPYSPWYPGDEYVDWIGISLYYKGPNFANINVNQPDGFIYDLIHGQNPFPGNGYRRTTDWYQTYCVDKPTKACIFSEAGAAWHKNADLVASAQNTQAQMQQAWWRDGFLNESFRDQHPRIKGYFHFEFDKFEYDGGQEDERDYRLTNDSSVLRAFMQDFQDQATAFVTGNMTTDAAPNATAFEITPSGPVITATVTVNQTAPLTATYTQFYSGPFVDVSFAGTNTVFGATNTATAAAGPNLSIPGRIIGANNAQTAVPNADSVFGGASSRYGSSTVVTMLGVLAGALTLMWR